MYGLFGTLTTESDKSFATGAEATVEDDVLADAAFMEAAEITNESERSARDMQQGAAIADRLERQSALCTELGDNPDQITSGVAAMTRESMALAMVALGGVNEEYTVSNESILDAPVQALEVTNEGLKDTAKKIYAGIKMAFQKIANNIKKLAAKIIVVMNNTGKKAEKMQKAFKSNSKSKATKTNIDKEEALSIMKSSGGYRAVKEAFSTNDVQTTLQLLSDNVAVIAKADEDIISDIATVRDNVTALAKTSVTAESSNIADAVVEAVKKMGGKLESAAAKKAADVIDGKPPVALEEKDFSNIKSMDISDKLNDLNLNDEYIGTPLFIPTYVKGNNIYGVVFYTKKDDDVNSTDVNEVFNLFTHKEVHIEAYDDTALEAASEKLPVEDKTNIITALGNLKPASKQLKSFSDARMKNIDSVMKAINKAAKDQSGPSIFNRLSSSTFNKAQMFAASTHISSIFAAAKLYKSELAIIAKHISYYK